MGMICGVVRNAVVVRYLSRRPMHEGLTYGATTPRQVKFSGPLRAEKYIHRRLDVARVTFLLVLPTAQVTGQCCLLDDLLIYTKTVVSFLVYIPWKNNDPSAVSELEKAKFHPGRISTIPSLRYTTCPL